MRAYAHTGVGLTYNESAQHFDSEKPSLIFLVLRTVFEPLSWNPLDLEADVLPFEPPRPPK